MKLLSFFLLALFMISKLFPRNSTYRQTYWASVVVTRRSRRIDEREAEGMPPVSRASTIINFLFNASYITLFFCWRTVSKNSAMTTAMTSTDRLTFLL